MNHRIISATKGQSEVKLNQNIVKRNANEDRIKTLTENIRHNPYNSQLYYHRGILYAHLEKIKEAFNDYNRSLKLDSKFAKAYYARAELYADLNNNELAMMDLQKAMELESSDGKVA
jgi:tetratricopeptide (TPR) repeat protein